jgi:hypothetical protein
MKRFVAAFPVVISAAARQLLSNKKLMNTICIACIVIILLNTLISPVVKSTVNQKSCIITISAYNNFGFVIALFKSVSASNRELSRCFVWVAADRQLSTFEKAMSNVDKITKGLGIKVVTTHDLQKCVPFPLEEIAFKYDLAQYSSAIKPWAILWTFQNLKTTSVIFLDNDIWVSGSLQPILSHLRHRSVVLTPHYTVPAPEDGRDQRDIELIKAGVYNSGFIGFSLSKTSIQFLTYWGERLRFYGYIDKEQGMFSCQTHLQFIPAFFDHDDYIVLRDPQYNVAYWNLHYTGAGLHLGVDGLPHLGDGRTVAFMHFSSISSFASFDPNKLSKHQNRFTLTDFPKLRPVFDAYMQMLNKSHVAYFQRIPYGFNYFSDNVSLVVPWMRGYFASMVGPKNPTINYFSEREKKVIFQRQGSSLEYARRIFNKSVVADPFLLSKRCADESSDETERASTFWCWLLRGPYFLATEFSNPRHFSELEYLIWMASQEIRVTAPNPAGVNRFEFTSWFAQHGTLKYRLSPHLIQLWKCQSIETINVSQKVENLANSIK